MLKHELREKYKALRAGLDATTLEAHSLLLANQALRLPIWNFSYFHIFLSIATRKEVDTLPLITLLQGRDKHVIVPKIQTDNTMVHYVLTDSTTLKQNAWHIPEPVDGISVPESKIDVVFVPLLAFDTTGNRVGYGKGYYDTFLQQCRNDTLRIGLSLFEAEAENITDVEDHDVKLTHCITPEQVYAF